MAAWSLRSLKCSSFIFPTSFPTFRKHSVSHLRLEKCMEEALKKIYVMAAYVLLLVIRAMFHLRLEIWPWWPELFGSWPALFRATGPLHPPLLILPALTEWSTVGLMACVGLLNPPLHRGLNSLSHTRPPGDSTQCPCKTLTLLLVIKVEHRRSIAHLLLWS